MRTPWVRIYCICPPSLPLRMVPSATKRKNRPKVASGGRHKAAGAAIGLSCGGCFERSASVFADRDATDMYALGSFSEDACPQVH